MCFPYMEQNAVWDRWTQDFTTDPATSENAHTPPIEGLTCPSDAPETIGEPWLNYVGNAGQGLSDTTRSGDTNGARRQRRVLRQRQEHRYSECS